MKKTILFFLLLFLAIPEITNAQKLDDSPLLNKPVPGFEGITLGGKKINKAYFKGKVTLLNFMYIGCIPCMMEVGSLNEIHLKNKSNPNFQLLGISANTAEQLRLFNAETDANMYNRYRTLFKNGPIAYDLLPECEKERVKPENALGAECSTISDKFLFNGHPTTFLIDKKGIIRKVHPSFPMKKNELTVGENGQVNFPADTKNQAFIQELQAEIDALLMEQYFSHCLQLLLMQ